MYQRRFPKILWGRAKGNKSNVIRGFTYNVFMINNVYAHLCLRKARVEHKRISRFENAAREDSDECKTKKLHFY